MKRWIEIMIDMLASVVYSGVFVAIIIAAIYLLSWLAVQW